MGVLGTQRIPLEKRSSKTGVRGSCQMVAENQHPGSLEEQPMLLTIEPSLEPPKHL